jgi:hypothetical protein
VFEQAEMILYAILDPAIASKARKIDFVRCLDHFDLLQSPMCDPLAESRYAESALEGWGRVTGKMRKSFQG